MHQDSQYYQSEQQPNQYYTKSVLLDCVTASVCALPYLGCVHRGWITGVSVKVRQSTKSIICRLIVEYIPLPYNEISRQRMACFCFMITARSSHKRYSEDSAGRVLYRVAIFP